MKDAIFRAAILSVLCVAGCSPDDTTEKTPGSESAVPAIPSVAEPTPVPGEVKPPILVDAPMGWKVDYRGKQGIPLYVLSSKEGGMRFLVFSRWPATDDPGEIPRLMKVLADGFVAQSVDREDLRLESHDYKVEALDGEEFKGQYAAFKVPAETQVLFVISGGDGIWNGQFAGAAEAWPAALDVLKKLKRNND